MYIAAQLDEDTLLSKAALELILSPAACECFLNVRYGQTFKFCQSDGGEMAPYCDLNFNFLDCL